jgi:hypothetical protein
VPGITVTKYARHLGRSVRAPVAEPDGADQRLQPVAVGALATDAQRQRDVLLGREHREQVVGLEDEADGATAQQREVAIVELIQARAVDLDPPVGRTVEAREDVQ